MLGMSARKKTFFVLIEIADFMSSALTIVPIMS